MAIRPLSATISLLLPLLFLSCVDGIVPPGYQGPLRTFQTSFETEADFSPFYIVTPGDYDSSHGLSADQVHEGSFAHKAWILKARADTNDGWPYLPHRAYPTVQFHKTEDGIYRTPCLVSLWVNLDIVLADRPSGQIDDWFSFITLSPDTSDDWTRTVLVNITPSGYALLVHVPRQGEQDRIWQASAATDPGGALLFPYRTWTRLDILIDFAAEGGYAKVWQSGQLVSHALVEGGEGALAQAHFGLYASAALASGTIWNDKLRIKEVADEAEALSLLGDGW